MTRKTLHTKLCDLLHIEHPVCQAAMGSLLPGLKNPAGAELAIAVSSAGGLGTLATAALTPQELRQEIRKIKSHTSRPFGVNIVAPQRVPERAKFFELKAQLPAEQAAFIQRLKEKFNIPDPAPVADFELATRENTRRMAQIAMEEGVPVVSLALGTPPDLVADFHARGTKVIALVGNVRSARRAASAGADVVVATGHEAGGHTGRVGTLALVPQVVDAICPTPVVAAGGIGDGRGLAAALALGAVGVWVGTAFLVSDEADVPDWYKQRILEATDESTGIYTFYTGKTSRCIPNVFTAEWERSGLPSLPMPLQTVLLVELMLGALEGGKGPDFLLAACGQVSGMLKERRKAKEVVEGLVEGALEALEGLWAFSKGLGQG